jgi:transcription antitermination factor NusG
MQRQIETFLPVYRANRQWKKRGQVILELPLFPNYLFVRIPPHMRRGVLGVRGILSIVGVGRDPSPVSDYEIQRIRAGLHLTSIQPHSYINVGEQVRIRTGPLATMSGIALRTNNKLRVVLGVPTIMRSFVVEVDEDNVEPVR